MSNYEDLISKVLKKNRIFDFCQIVENKSEENSFFIFIEKFFSEKLKKSLVEHFIKHNISVEFIFKKNDEDLEKILRLSLLKVFPNKIRNCFLSLERNTYCAWVDLKVTLDKGLEIEIKKHIEKFSEIFSIKNISLIDIKVSNTPTKFEILKMLKIIAPASLDEIREYIISKKYKVPSLDWLNRQLDKVRKEKYIIRIKNGNYVLTLEILQKMGTLKSSKSDDIRRFLALNSKRR